MVRWHPSLKECLFRWTDWFQNNKRVLITCYKKILYNPSGGYSKSTPSSYTDLNCKSSIRFIYYTYWLVGTHFPTHLIFHWSRPFISGCKTRSWIKRFSHTRKKCIHALLNSYPCPLWWVAKDLMTQNRNSLTLPWRRLFWVISIYP